MLEWHITHELVVSQSVIERAKFIIRFVLGIRLLDGEVTDLVESMALSFRPDFIDIYSASW
jgi:hypothetical protein